MIFQTFLLVFFWTSVGTEYFMFIDILQTMVVYYTMKWQCSLVFKNTLNVYLRFFIQSTN